MKKNLTLIILIFSLFFTNYLFAADEDTADEDTNVISGGAVHSFEVSASLFDAASPIVDTSNCKLNEGSLSLTESITCTYTSFKEDLGVQALVEALNHLISRTNAYIPSDAQTVIEAYAGKGPPKRFYYDDRYSRYTTTHTGEPGAPGYAATAVSLNDLDTLSIYVGQNGKADTFGAGSASLVSRKKLEDISEENITKPREAGILMIAGSGGAGGGWKFTWSGLSEKARNGIDGYAGGQAPLNVYNDVSAAGAGKTGDGLDGEGGNLYGEGSGGAGEGYSADRAGTKGIGGFGGMDRYSENYQSVFKGASVKWAWGAGGDCYGGRGFASGGGGFGGGGGGGKTKYHKGGGGGGGSWSRQATIDPDPKLVHGPNKESDPKVLITFEVESMP